jgi:hypothetical protein
MNVQRRFCATGLIVLSSFWPKTRRLSSQCPGNKPTEKWSWMAFIRRYKIVTYLHFQSYHVSNVFHVLDAERYFQLLYHSVRLHSSPFTLSSFRDPREKRSGRSYGTGNKDHRRKNPAGNYRSNKYKRERNERVTPQEKRPRLAQAHRVFLVLELCGVWYWFFLGP